MALFVVLQVIIERLSALGELVSMMEQDPCYSIEKLYVECESRFLKTIGTKLSKEWREVDKEQL